MSDCMTRVWAAGTFHSCLVFVTHIVIRMCYVLSGCFCFTQGVVNKEWCSHIRSEGFCTCWFASDNVLVKFFCGTELHLRIHSRSGLGYSRVLRTPRNRAPKGTWRFVKYNMVIFSKFMIGIMKTIMKRVGHDRFAMNKSFHDRFHDRFPHHSSFHDCFPS